MTGIAPRTASAELNAAAEDPNLWNSPERAQKVMRERQQLADQIDAVERIERELADQIELIELGEAEDDLAVVVEAEAALRALRAEAERRQVETMLSGEADGNDSYLEIHAGAGGTESQDWAEMLMRMYTRWAERNGYKVEILEVPRRRGGGHQVGDAADQGRRAPMAG